MYCANCCEERLYEMQLNPVTYSDLTEIRKLQPDGWSDIVPDFEFYINSPFCNPVKTEIDNKIVGVGASIIFEKTSWIAHIIVDSNYRKRGIGTTIVNQLLKSLRDDSIDTCLLIATELGLPIYEKAGFRAVTGYSYLKKERPCDKMPVSVNVIPFAEKHRSMIYDLDKEISGENRSKLLKDYLGNSLVYIENNRVSGYYVPALKDGLICAERNDVGIELMKTKFCDSEKATLPSDNIAGIDFLKQNGFVESGVKGTRMILGKDIDWHPEKIFNRIGGNFG